MSLVSAALILLFSSNLSFVSSEKIGELANRQFGVSGTVHTFTDGKMILIVGFTYDGECWLLLRHNEASSACRRQHWSRQWPVAFLLERKKFQLAKATLLLSRISAAI